MAALAAANARGELEAVLVPEVHKDFARRADRSVAQAGFRAMASWPTVEAAALSCPALFYAGSKNAAGMNTFEKHGDALRASGVRCEVLDGLDHMGEFTSIDRALPLVLRFLDRGVRGS